MNNDRYLRGVLTVIAAALVYLCVVLTPLPTASAQEPGRVVGAPIPGVSTGPAEMVIVGWRVPDTIPVTVARGDVRVTGRVEAAPAPNTLYRTTLVGWEEGGRAAAPGPFRQFGGNSSAALPVVVRPPKP
jgi:hypothetical protein